MASSQIIWRLSGACAISVRKRWRLQCGQELRRRRTPPRSVTTDRRRCAISALGAAARSSSVTSAAVHVRSFCACASRRGRWGRPAHRSCFCAGERAVGSGPVRSFGRDGVSRGLTLGRMPIPRVHRGGSRAAWSAHGTVVTLPVGTLAGNAETNGGSAWARSRRPRARRSSTRTGV
jgi:hypothetical protein